MRYAGIIYDDTAAAPGLSLSFFTQGCPFHCKGCHNQETWDFDGGYEYTEEVQEKIFKGLKANGVLRNFCIMGGEPLIDKNLEELLVLIRKVRELYGEEISIWIWTGYTTEALNERKQTNPILSKILSQINTIVTGPYIEELRDISNPLCGSSNQEVIYLRKE